jgi:hypothetical protein
LNEQFFYNMLGGGGEGRNQPPQYPPSPMQLQSAVICVKPCILGKFKFCFFS